MRMNAVIISQMVREEIPKTIKVDDNTSLSVKDTTVVVTEFDRKETPFITSEYEKGFSVGVKVLVERRQYAKNAVSVVKDHIGDFVYLPEDASIRDVMNAINDLVRKISNPNA